MDGCSTHEARHGFPVALGDMDGLANLRGRLRSDGLTLRPAGQRLPVLFRCHPSLGERGAPGPKAYHGLERVAGESSPKLFDQRLPP